MHPIPEDAMDELDAEVERKASAWLERIEALPGRHVALEALWDGDTEGWWLGVRLVTATTRTRGWWRWTRTEIDHTRTSLDSLRYGGDIRLFEGTVPPWPEALVVQRAGAKVAAAVGIELYFPSPDVPDDDCPHWSDLGAAARCGTCGKPIVGRGSSPTCRPCELQDEKRAALLADQPGSSEGITCVRVGSDGSERLIYFGLPSDDEAWPDETTEIAEQLSALLRSRAPPVELSGDIEVALDAVEVASVRAWCEDRIDALLRVYEDEEFSDRATHPHTFAWRGAQRTIQRYMNETGHQIWWFLSWHSLMDPAAERVHLFRCAGLTTRDASVLARLRAGARTTAELRASFPFLPSEAIERTLAKLEERRFLVRDGEAVRLLLKGRVAQ
jgi:hypothetical protein